MTIIFERQDFLSHFNEPFNFKFYFSCHNLNVSYNLGLTLLSNSHLPSNHPFRWSTKRGSIMDLEKIILKHQESYPQMEEHDFYKLIYQHSFGIKHYFMDRKDSLDYLLREYNELTDDAENTDVSFLESIGNGLVRINLAAEKVTYSMLPLLNKLFIATSKKINFQTYYFEKNLALLQHLVNEGKLNVKLENVQTMIDTYKKSNYPPVHHSKIYRKLYKPHYRVIDENYMKYLPVIQEIEKLLEENKKIVVAIDGRCGSGKTIMAQVIQEVFDSNVVHMDDFFLPADMKTNERLSEPGGNVHYERVKSELLEPWRNQESKVVVYQPYNCSTQTFDSPISIPYKQLNILEGVYSMHPTLVNYYDFKIFLTAEKEVQIERINKRNPDKLQMFIHQWIPMEEHYFQSAKLEEKSDIVFDTSKIF